VILLFGVGDPTPQLEKIAKKARIWGIFDQIRAFRAFRAVLALRSLFIP